LPATCFWERSASWLGAKLQRPLSRILVRLKREPLEDGARKAVDLRARALAILREGWALGTIGVAANLLLTYLILLAALRFVGVTSAELSASAAFAAFAIAFWAGAVFPITGSGLGVVDAVLIAMLIELGSASDDALVAAALLWRVFYSVITLPLGAITLARFRKAPATAVERGMNEAPTVRRRSLAAAARDVPVAGSVCDAASEVKPSTSLTRRCSALSDPSVQAKPRLGLERWGQILGTS
jgi:hypothetical protein